MPYSKQNAKFMPNSVVAQLFLVNFNQLSKRAIQMENYLLQRQLIIFFPQILNFYIFPQQPVFHLRDHEMSR